VASATTTSDITAAKPASETNFFTALLLLRSLHTGVSAAGADRF